MDLPSCPACGQSVLDDVEDCPFCGASMTTGRPSKKPASSAASAASSATKTTAAAKPEPSSTATGPAKTRPQPQSDSADPFAVETSAKAAVRAAPQPAKGRSYKVVCPMCETAGYIPKKAAGHDVRCANPKCLVPVFTAPKIEEKPAEPEPPPKTGPSPALLAAAAVVLIAVGGGAWYLFFKDGGGNPSGRPTVPVIGEPNPRKNQDDPQSDPDSPAVSQDDPKTINGAPPKAPELTLDQIEQRALNEMIEASRRRDNNRSKAFCRRLTAEAFAVADNLPGAREQLDQLQKVGPEVPFYQITPLVTIAWKELAAGETEAAGKTANEAWTASKRLPQYGRDPLDTVTALAALLVAVGRTDDAEILLADRRDSPVVRRLSATLHAVRVLRIYNLDAAVIEPLRFSKAPQHVAVTLDLTAHGRWDEALAWANRPANIEERTDCVVAWAAAFAQHALQSGQPEKLARIDQAAQPLPPAGKAKLRARVAGSQLLAGDRPGAEESLAAARTALTSISPPPPFVLPAMKDVLDLSLPDPLPLRMAALAAMEVARVEAQLEQTPAAWNSLTKALEFTRGTASSLPAIRQRNDEIDSLGPETIRRQLKAALQLDSDDKSRLALNRYRNQCRDLLEAAQARFELQTDILTQAAEWDVRDELWQEVQARANETKIDHQEPYFDTSLPWILADRYRRAEQADKVQAIEAALGDRTKSRDPWEQTQQETARLVAAGNVKQAAQRLERSPIEKTVRSEWVLRLACRLVESEKLDAAFQFVESLNDPIWREDAIELIAAFAARKGQARQVWNFGQKSTLPATEKVALYRGLLAGK